MHCSREWLLLESWMYAKLKYSHLLSRYINTALICGDWGFFWQRLPLPFSFLSHGFHLNNRRIQKILPLFPGSRTANRVCNCYYAHSWKWAQEAAGKSKQRCRKEKMEARTLYLGMKHFMLEDKCSASKLNVAMARLQTLKSEPASNLYNSFTNQIALEVRQLIGNASLFIERNRYENNYSGKRNCCGFV